MEEATVLNLLPVCECGYVFREFKVNKEMTTLDNYYIRAESRFEPPECPNCKQFIEAIYIPQDFQFNPKW